MTNNEETQSDQNPSHQTLDTKASPGLSEHSDRSEQSATSDDASEASPSATTDDAELVAIKRSTTESAETPGRISISSEGTRKSVTHSRKYSWKAAIAAVIAKQNLEEQAPRPHPLDDLDDVAVFAKVKELQVNLKRLKVENAVFTRYLEKNDPDALEVLDAPKRLISERTSVASSRRASIFSKMLIAKKSSISTFQGVVAAAVHQADKEPPKINITQKSDLIMRDLEEMQAKVDETKRKSHIIKCKLVARLEEMETRQAELNESINSFELMRHVVSFTLEKFVRFMDEWSKRSRLMADKLRLRYSSLKVQLQKLATVLAHKQLIGENLQEIDFEQLRIENLHLGQDIEKKTILLIELKKMTGRGNLTLSQHKKILQEKMVERESILEAIKSVEKTIGKSDDEIMKLYEEVDHVKHEYYNLKDMIRKYEIPDLIEYVRKKAAVENIQKELNMWSRRKLVKDMAMQIELKEMKRLLRCKHPHPAWFE